MKQQNLWKIVMGICFSLILVGCGEIGLMASETQTFTGNDSITLQAPRADILNIAAEVGKSLGYNVSRLDKDRGTISLSYDAGLFIGVMIGKIQNATLTISSENGENKLSVSVFLMGNFGEGGQEAAMGRIEDFKAKLLAKIGQRLN
jgi:hypothetical protein